MSPAAGGAAPAQPAVSTAVAPVVIEAQKSGHAAQPPSQENPRDPAAPTEGGDPGNAAARKLDIAKDVLFPEEVVPELQRLLTLLLQKFQPEWRDDTLKDQASVPNLEKRGCHLSQNQDASEQPDTTKLHSCTEPANDSSKPGEKEVKIHLAKDSLDKMLKDIYPTKDQVSNDVSANGHEEIAGSI